MFWFMEIRLSSFSGPIFQFQTVIHSKAEPKILMILCKSLAFYFLFSENRHKLWGFFNSNMLM